MATTQPYEILMRRNGQSWALHARSLTTLDDGTAIEGKAVPLAGLSDPAFAEVATLVGASKDNEIAALTAERDSLTQQLATMTTERDTALSEKASLQTQLDSANASLESANATIETLTISNTESQVSNAELTSQFASTQTQLETALATIAQYEAKAAEPIATMGQVRKWLIINYGQEIIVQVGKLLLAIEDPVQRACAISDWEYANIMLRDSSLVTELSAALGMTKEQTDAAYLAASQLP